MSTPLTMKKLQEQINELRKELRGMKKSPIRKKIGIGDTFELAGLNWKILDITEKGYYCLADRMPDSMKFDSDCNNWESSDLRNYLNTDFCKKLEEEIGEENIVEFERDLSSLDGQTEYGKCMDKVSLLSVDEYRKYRKLIPNADYWWLTLSPWSTKCNDDETWITVVSPRGDFNGSRYDYGNGVRPFCIFPSAIFESED